MLNRLAREAAMIGGWVAEAVAELERGAAPTESTVPPRRIEAIPAFPPPDAIVEAPEVEEDFDATIAALKQAGLWEDNDPPPNGRDA